MVNTYILIITEGVHDAAFVEKCLCVFCEFEKIPDKTSDFSPDWHEVYDYWTYIFPAKYPSTTNTKIYQRLEIPLMLKNATSSVAVFAAGGEKLFSTFPDFLQNITEKLTQEDKRPLAKIAIILDADNKACENCANELKQCYQHILDLSTPTVTDKTPASFYILPDNHGPGTLDTLLCACAKTAYPPLMEKSEEFCRNLNSLKDSLDILKKGKAAKWEGFNNFDLDKALIATMASVLYPGKTNTVFIQDRDSLLVSEKTAARLKDFLCFLRYCIKV